MALGGSSLNQGCVSAWRDGPIMNQSSAMVSAAGGRPGGGREGGREREREGSQRHLLTARFNAPNHPLIDAPYFGSCSISNR